MPISWNEIRQNAIIFSKEWASESREEAEAKTFWDAFFTVFGIKRRTVASFEEPVRKLTGTWGYIDLFWKGTLLAEHKSRGKPLDKAHAQAMEYIQALTNEGRERENPRYVVVSDFAKIALHDLDEETSVEFPLADLYQHVDQFAFIPGYTQHKLADQDPINIAAVELLGDLHDALEAGGYGGHELERFLVRILFCLFAEDTALFERNVFTDYVENHTAEDGSDLGMHLARLFQILNAPPEKRQKNLLEELAELPYVNGDLFAESLGFADFNRPMRDKLLTCCRFDWSRISPAVFGSLFQSIMDAPERRQIGAHYTSERDILKLVRSLFLDDLRAEFERLKEHKGTQRETRLKEFHHKLGTLTFLDPACGCGNFLVVTYRELRLLEIDVLKLLHRGQAVTNVQFLSVVDVDAMYGIEIEEFPAQIAQVALWLVDHQMNQRLSKAFGQYVVRLPLKKSATIRNANALRLDWNEVLPAAKCFVVLGNPPFSGSKLLTDEQTEDVRFVARDVPSNGVLDHVAAWYIKAANYIQSTNIRAAFVSTNSISQGEQVPVLWGELFRLKIQIFFAHRTFAWMSEARGKAHVHCIIIGFVHGEPSARTLFEYEDIKGAPQATSVANINPYLIDAKNILVQGRRAQLCKSPQMVNGSIPADGGNLIFTDRTRADLLNVEPQAARWLRTGLPHYVRFDFLQNLEQEGIVPASTMTFRRHGVPLAAARRSSQQRHRHPPHQRQVRTRVALPHPTAIFIKHDIQDPM